MRHLGRFQLGDEVTYQWVAGQPPAAPDAAPLAFVARSNGHRVTGGKAVPSREYPSAVGLFEGRLRLDERFSEGSYCVLVTWLASGVNKAELFSFVVVPGGDASGQITSLYSFVRPNGNFLVQGRDSGRIYKGKNPRE